MDICLVNMPFADLHTPSLSLGTLQAALEREKVTASSIYANLLFADQIGIEEYYSFYSVRAEDVLTDWFFASVAFPEFTPNDDAYIRMIKESNRSLRSFDYQDLRDSLFTMREEVQVFVERLAERILNMNPRIVGSTTTLLQHVASLALLRQIHTMAPEVITMMGGATCESVMGRTTHRNFPWVDYVVSGDAEDLIGGLVISVLESGRDLGACQLPEGVFAPVHRGDGYPIVQKGGYDNAPRAVIDSFDDLSVPNYDDYFNTLQSLPKLSERITPGLFLETSRGCWWGLQNGCSFCGLSGKVKSYRSKKPEHALGELHALCVRYGITRFECVDNVLDMDYFNTVLHELKNSGSPYRIFCRTRSNLNRQQVKDLRDAGVFAIGVGIESLDSRILALINKGVGAWENVQMLKWCRQNGVNVRWNMLYGIPGEKDNWYLEMAECLPLLVHMQPPIAMQEIVYHRYSHYHMNPEAHGLRLIPSIPASFVYPLSGKELDDQMPSFEDDGRMDTSRDPIKSILSGREGTKATARKLLEWMKIFNSKDRPVLIMTDTSTALHIRDTRPAATSASFILKGIEREVYLACDNAPKVEYLKKSFIEMGIDEEAIMSIVKSLLADKLLLSLDGRLIALALTEPLIELPEQNEFSVGVIAPASKKFSEDVI